MRAAMLLVVAALAGCTAPLATDAPSYELTADIPDQVFLGEELQFRLQVAGASAYATDHIGAHWWTSSQGDPTAALSTSTGCAHQEGTLPGAFDVTCAFAAPGIHHVRGHARVDVEGVLHNYWTEDHEVHVVPSPGQWNLAAEGIPEEVTIGQEFTFTLTIDGEPAVDSKHIGGHWWASGEAGEMDLSMSHGGCSHQEGSVPGTYNVTCDMEHAGTYDVFGHMRVTVGEQNFEYWSDAHPVTVS